MSEYSKKAVQNFKQGYNCAQSVLLAFKDRINLDEETILRLSSSFGGGMGRLREVCGAVSAMFMIAGLLKGYTTPNDDTRKAEHYKLIQTLALEFKKRHNTIICRELLGLESNDSTADAESGHETTGFGDKNGPLNTENEAFSYIPSKRTEEYYKSRPCEVFIQTAAEIATETLIKECDIRAGAETVEKI